MFDPPPQKSESLPVIDLEQEQHTPLRVDPHCHLLPGIDDGSKSVQTSLQMARKAAAEGVEIIIATQHAPAERHTVVRVACTPGELRERAAALQESVSGEGISIRVGVGQEILVDAIVPELFEAGRLLSWGDQGRYVLLELGFSRLNAATWDVLDYFASKKLTPIIAHPERYSWWDDAEADVLPRLTERGCWFQFNVMSVTGGWGPKVEARAARLIENVPRAILGTDAHSDAPKYWDIAAAKRVFAAARAKQGERK